jgi:choline-sulfatase
MTRTVPPRNLVFIMSDEHNAAFLGCEGHATVKTPVLDALAARGTLFENAYTNCPICVPARASFATGRYVHECRNWDNAFPYHGGIRSWGQRLIEQGHRVVSIGKLHYRSTNDDNGFDEEVIPLHVVDGVGDLIGLLRDPLPERQGARKMAEEAGRGPSSYTDYDLKIAAEAVRWITEEAPKYEDKPWALFVSFVCPHFPLIAPDEFYDMYADADLAEPLLYEEAERPSHPYYKAMRGCTNYDKHFDGTRRRKGLIAYHGMCSFLDRNIGTVVGALDDAGRSDDTRIIYTSDHGEALGKRGLWGKSTMFEESARVPLIMAGPDIASGHRVKTPVSLVDGFPTIVEAVGGKLNKDDDVLPGESLFALAQTPDAERTVFSEYHAVGSSAATFMIRRDQYKLVYFVGMEPELFNLDADPHETLNLAADPEYAEVRARLEGELRQICDPEEIDRQARDDQAAKVKEHGGQETIIQRGDFGYSPAPGQRPSFAS